MHLKVTGLKILTHFRKRHDVDNGATYQFIQLQCWKNKNTENLKGQALNNKWNRLENDLAMSHGVDVKP